MSAKTRVVVGLSGGVDSAVTAHLLKQQGHEVIGIFMKNREGDDDSESCSSNIDFVDAAAVTDVIGIEIGHVSFAADHKDQVFAESCANTRLAARPPLFMCNAEIKFKAFLDPAFALGARHDGITIRDAPAAGAVSEPCFSPLRPVPRNGRLAGP